MAGQSRTAFFQNDYVPAIHVLLAEFSARQHRIRIAIPNL